MLLCLIRKVTTHRKSHNSFNVKMCYSNYITSVGVFLEEYFISHLHLLKLNNPPREWRMTILENDYMMKNMNNKFFVLYVKINCIWTSKFFFELFVVKHILDLSGQLINLIYLSCGVLVYILTTLVTQLTL